MIGEDTLNDSNENALSDCTHYSPLNPSKGAPCRSCKNSRNCAPLKWVVYQKLNGAVHQTTTA